MRKTVFAIPMLAILVTMYVRFTPSISLFTQDNQCNDDNQKIAYVSDDAVDQSDIYVVDMSGTNRSNLTQSKSLNDSPNCHQMVRKLPLYRTVTATGKFIKWIKMVVMLKI